MLDKYTKNFLRKRLVPRHAWRPFPRAADRKKWSGVLSHPQHRAGKREIIRQAGWLLGQPWPQLTATLYMDFIRNGDRARFEAPYFQRRQRLAVLALAECFEYRGRFIDEIINGLWLICEETTWCLPAHAERMEYAPGLCDALPRPDHMTADLFACETALSLAEVGYLLKPELDKQSPMISQRLAREVEARVLTPVEKRNDFGWFKGTNNWTPWCSANILGAAMYLLDDRDRLARLAHKLMRCVDRFIAGFGPDGGTSEGPSYWGVAAGMMLHFLEFLYDRSRGAISVYDEPLVKNMGEYILKVHLDGQWFANFADCPTMVTLRRSSTYRYGERVGSPEMQNLVLWGLRGWKKRGAVRPVIQQGLCGGDLSFMLRELFWVPATARPRPFTYLLTTWLPDLQVMTARETAVQGKGLALAAKAGHNGECHNHNDVGQFIILLDGLPVIVDAGVGTYTRATFSAQRWNIWNISAEGHNVPQVNGCLQLPGKEFRAEDVHYASDAAGVKFSMDLAKTYEAAAGLTSLKREIKFTRDTPATVTVTDTFAARKKQVSMSLPLYTPGRPRQRKPGVWELPAGKNALVLEFDPSFLKCGIRRMLIDDKGLAKAWGTGLFKLMLTTKNKHKRGEYRLCFTAKRR